MKGLSIAWLCLAFTVSGVHAGIRDDYVRQWNLSGEYSEGGIYRVVLDRDVYRQVHTAQLQDIEVFNGQGQSLPAVLMEPAPVPVPSAGAMALPWFALPAAAGADNTDDVTMRVERNADGSVRSAGVRILAEGTVSASPSSWLVDASQMRDPIHGLLLEWEADSEPFEQYMEVEGSDDLRHWHQLASRAPLLNLVRDGQALRHDRIVLNSRYRYLRLRASHGGKLPLTGVRADFAMPAAPLNWQWEELRGKRVVEQGQEYFEFELNGRFPVALADVRLGDSDTRRWTLWSREAGQDAWQARAPSWVAYAVRMDGQEVRSAPQPLRGISRDRHWRLASDVPVGEASVPVLRLGYRPESLVFMAQGGNPYALAAGSAKAVRAPSSLAQTMEMLKRQSGRTWNPTTVSLSSSEVLAGEAALAPVVQRDWKTWTLWGMLIAGTVIVAGFAFSLLRRSSGGEN